MLSLIAAIAVVATPTALDEVPAQRVSRLTKGINLSHWWAQADSYSLDRIRHQMVREDFRQLSESGFRHVRLTLEPRALWDGNTPVVLEPEKLKALKEDIKEIQSEKLAVIVDVHPDDTLKQALAENEEKRSAFVAFWAKLAEEFKESNPDWTFLEILNEPVIDHDAWVPLQESAVKMLRSVLPRHTIIVSGGKWSGIEEFLKLTPYSDKNLVYNFHSYDPFHFTHQGATWGWEATRHFRNLPYPSSPALISPILPNIDESARGFVKDYGDQRWNGTKLEALFRKCSEWGRRHRVPITCNEFGAYKQAPRESRLRYIKDARSGLETNNIGWAMWDYAGGFGAFSGTSGDRVADREVLAALGLR